MIRYPRSLAGGLAILCLCAAAADLSAAQKRAARKPAPAKPAPAKPAPPEPVAAGPAVPAPADLSKEELAAATRTDEVSIPTPGEFMAALDKQGKPDWAAQLRPSSGTKFIRRAQMALNLGGLVADGYIAVEAEDAQRVKDLGRDILDIARALGVSKDIQERGKSLTEKSDDKQWDVLREELEATQNEVKQSLVANQDQPLIDLVTVGGWVRGVEVVSGLLAERYSEAGARLVRQPAIVESLLARLKALPEKLRDDPVVKATGMKLEELKSLVDFPPEKAPTIEQIKKLNTLAAELMQTIATKDKK